MSRFSTRAPEPAAPPSTPTTGVRGALDSIVQSSLVELFAAYGMAVAPLPRAASHRVPTIPDVSSTVAFTRRGVVGSGRITLSLPSAVLELTKSAGSGALQGDWARELANQLLGRIKNRLLQFSVRLEAGISSSIDSRTLAAQLPRSSSTLVYTGRTLRGEILVTLEGAPDESQLIYLGPVNVAAEGEAILF